MKEKVQLEKKFETLRENLERQVSNRIKGLNALYYIALFLFLYRHKGIVNVAIPAAR